MNSEALGTDMIGARARALELNASADEMRNSISTRGNGPRPGTMSRLFQACMASDAFRSLKPRTRADYKYYLAKIEAEFGDKAHAAIRAAAGLPKQLQLQDFRRTAQTEAGAAGATADELRALAQHTTRESGSTMLCPTCGT